MSRLIVGGGCALVSITLLLLALFMSGDGTGASILFVSLALAFFLAASVLLGSSRTNV
jgi:hypothetical protein